MCSWVSPPTMWTVVTRTMLDPSPTFPSMRKTFAFQGRAAIRSGAGDLGNEGGRDPGGDGAPNPGEAFAGQRLSPAPQHYHFVTPRGGSCPARLGFPYSWRAFFATHIPQATASSSVSCSRSHTPDQGPSLLRMTGSL